MSNKFDMERKHQNYGNVRDLLIIKFPFQSLSCFEGTYIIFSDVATIYMLLVIEEDVDNCAIH